jgi:solute carrier family 13 (sodium-dependent dicarboxylate transporter), member 2/3/5
MEAVAREELDDILDLEKHRLAVIPEKQVTGFERKMKYFSIPAGFLIFAWIYFMPTPEGLTASGQAVLASFALALVLWISEAIPTHVTSLVLMVFLVFLNGWEMSNVLASLGYDVIWLNVMAFILSSLLVKTQLAKRIALNLIVRFGHRGMSTLLAFLMLQLILAPLIPATAARAVMTLPIMLIVGAIYGSTSESPNSFGKNLLLQNLVGINVASSGFMTGSTANIIAIAYIHNLAGTKVYYSDWMFANLPVVILLLLATWYIGPKLLIRLKPECNLPQISGGIDALKRQLDRMGKITPMEMKGAAIFGIVVLLWLTDRFHKQIFGFEIDPVMAALVGGIIALLPKVGLLKWNEADIPWHLMLFSAGAYAGGLALNDTGAAQWVVSRIFALIHFGGNVPFWQVYTVVVGLMLYSHLVFTSKTMRTIILIPFIIGLARTLGINPLALALPAAFTIDWVIGLPISAKPNVILFTTGQYSVLENIRYGVIVSTIGLVLLIVAGFTWFHFLGITP